jgi:hypothetical protein
MQLEVLRENGFKFSAKKEYAWSDEHENKIDRYNKRFTNMCPAISKPWKEKSNWLLRHTFGSFRKKYGGGGSYELAIQMGTDPKND